MCLSSVNMKIRVRPRTGYKFYKKVSDYQYRNIYQNTYEVISANEWYSTKIIKNLSRHNYPAGIHIFRTAKEAMKARKSRIDFTDSNVVLKKVKYLNVVAEGIDCGVRCVVAQNCMITNDEVNVK